MSWPRDLDVILRFQPNLWLSSNIPTYSVDPTKLSLFFSTMMSEAPYRSAPSRGCGGGLPWRQLRKPLAYCDGGRAEDRSRQISLAWEDNNQPHESANKREMRSWCMQVDSQRFGGVPIGELSWSVDLRLAFGGFLCYQLKCINRELFSCI